MLPQKPQREYGMAVPVPSQFLKATVKGTPLSSSESASTGSAEKSPLSTMLRAILTGVDSFQLRMAEQLRQWKVRACFTDNFLPSPQSRPHSVTGVSGPAMQ